MGEYSSDKILQAKNQLDKELKDFVKIYPTFKKDDNEVRKLITNMISEHSNVLSTVNIAIGKTHQESDFFMSKDLQSDYLVTLNNFLPVSFQIIDILNQIVNKHKLTRFEINGSSYETIQRFLNTFGDSRTNDSFKQEFNSRNISIKGFNKKFKRMKDKYLRVQLIIGIPLLILSLLIIFTGEYFLGKDFNGIQLISLKILIALSVSIVGSSLIEGSVQTNWTLQEGLTIRAVGWVAVFLLIYFLNPANPGDVY